MPEQICRSCDIPLPNEPGHCNRVDTRMSKSGLNHLIDRINWDDIVLLGLIIVLLTEEKVDTLLIIALFYLFVSGI